MIFIMEKLIYLGIGITVLVILVIIFRRRISEVGFQIPLFRALIKLSGDKSSGGRGGNATVVGSKGTAIGGKGGASGPGGKGGDGGDAHAVGDGSSARGGEAGEAGQADRGGKGGRGPLHVLMEDDPEKAKEILERYGISEEKAKEYGRGGDGSPPTN